MSRIVVQGKIKAPLTRSNKNERIFRVVEISVNNKYPYTYPFKLK